MASTKDLYDELKGNPIIKIKDDYDTFNLKLRDANYLKKLEDALAAIGDDINAYDIPKKKKDGEEESSQPTEQPSATTEETQAVGVEPEGRPQEGEPGYNRELGPDQAFIDRGFTDYGTYWRNLKTGELVYKPKKEANKKPDMPVADLQEPAQAPEMPETPELMAPEKPIEEQVLETQAAKTPNTDVNNENKTTVVGSVISEQEPNANKVNKIVDDANAVSGNTYKRKKKPTDSSNQAVIAYTPSSASDTVYVSQNGKVKSLDKRSSEYSEIISKNPYTVQLKNSDAFKDLLQLQKEGNKQGFQNYLETTGNPAAQEIADRAFGGFSNEPLIESTIISGDNKDREIPIQNTLLGKLKSTNLYQATEGLWNNIINKNVDRPWQEEKEYDTEDFINNIDPSLSEEEKQAQQAFDTYFPSDTEQPVTKAPRQLVNPLYVNPMEDNEIYAKEEEKRRGVELVRVNRKTGQYEFGNLKDIDNFYETESNRVARTWAEKFMKQWDAETAKEVRSEMEDAQAFITGKPGKRYVSEFKNDPKNKRKHELYEDYQFWPINGGTDLEVALQTIENKQADADYKDLHQNGYNNAYSTEIRTPYDIQSELDGIDKILDAQPKMPYEEKMKLYKQKENLNQALLNVYEQNIKDYATYLRNTDHEKAAADMLSTYDYYKRKTAGFQTMPVKELDDAEKRAIMNIRNQAVNTTMRYLQVKYQTLSNTVDTTTYQKLAKKPMEVVGSQFEILKSIGALDENGNINPSARIKQGDQVKLSDAVLKINLAKDQIASAAEATGATPENLNELTRLGEKLGNIQNTQTTFYQKNAMEDLKEEDENEKKNQKIAEDRMRSEDFFTSFFYTALYGGSNLFISGLSTLAKIGKVPDNIADALGDETFVFDGLSTYVDELIKDMNSYQPQDMQGISGVQKFWMNTTAGIGSLGAYALTGIAGGPVLTALTMMSDMTDMAKANGLDDDEAAKWGVFTSLILGRINQLVPDSKSFYDALKPSIKNILKDYAKGKITYQEAMAMFNRTIVPSLSKHLKQIGGETGEEMLEDLSTQLLGMSANLVWNNASFNKDFDPNSIIGAGESAASLTAFLAPFKGGRRWSSVEQDALLSLVQNKETVLKNISFKDQDELNEITKQLTQLENLEKGLVTMPGYSELSNGDKAKILTDLYVAEAMELGAKNRGLGKKDPGFIEAERMREEILNSLKAPKKGEIPTQPELQNPNINAVQKPSTTEVLPSQQGEVRETGRKRPGMEPSVQGEEVAQEGGKKKVNSTEESQAYVDKLTEVKNNDPETYWSVSIPEVEDVENGTIITNEDGQAVVGADGDIKAVYKNPDSEARRVSDTLLKEAIKAGGIKLDNFDIYLTKLYLENGFRIVSRLPFNEEFAPDGWNKAKHGTPDVVAMIYDPEGKLDIEEKQFTNEQYDEAMAYRDTYVDAQKEAYAKATESEVDAKAQEQRNSVADNLRKWKADNGNMYSAGLGIPIAIWNGAIETIATALEAGVSLADAIQKAKDYLKRNYGKEYNEKQFAEDVMNISLDKVMGDKAKFVETTKEVADEVESGVIEGKSVNTWIKFSNKIVDKITKRKEKVEVFRGEVNQENVKENAQESYNSTALKLAQYNVFASEDFKNIVQDFSKLPAKKQKQLISDYAGLIDKKIASIQKSIGKLDKKDENYKTDKEEYDNDIKALKEAKKNKSFEDMLTSLDQFSPNTKASIISDIFLNKEIVYNNKGEAVDYKKLNKDQQTKKAEAIYQKAKETVISNLTAVYNSVDPAIRNLSKLWYDGANLISQEFGKQYDLTLEQSAAIIATQSPQMPWFQNLHLAHAIMDIMKTQADTPFSQEMLDLYIKNTKGYKDQKAYIPEVKKLVGKKLSELSEYDASIFVRSYYELNMDKRSPIRIPSGTIVGYENKIASFSGYDTIAKGVSLFRDGSQENISKRLGDANKVRNFYLNIANPNDDRAVTIDTHAMAIALMKPLGSSSYEVNFTPPYFAFYADAYREAAEKLGIKTRELQSITWEAARAIFPADEKTDSKKSEVSAIWDKYNNGEITLQEAQNQILQDGKDPNITEWAEFTGKLLDSGQRAEIFLPIRPSERAKTTTEVGDGAGTGGDVPGVGGGNNGKRTSTKIAKGLRKGAEVARKGKTGGLAVNPIDPFLEVIAKALEAGASLTEAIAKGIEAFKNSDFYKNLTAPEKNKALNDLKRTMDEQIAPTIANLINEEMLKGKGLYTATENVKKQMIKDGVIDEATFDRIVGKSEKLVKADAEMMFSVAVEDAKEAIKAGKTVDEAVAILNDAVNKQIGFYSNLDKSIKKDMVAKAQAKMMSEVAGEIAGLAKSYADTQGIPRSEAIKQAMDETKSSGFDTKVVDNLKDSIESEYDKIKARDRGDSNKKEPVVTTTDREIMKDKLKAMDAALKEAVEKAKEDEKEKRQLVRNWIKEYLKTSGIFAKISPVQMRAIALRAVGLVSDMPDSKMKALMDYVQKVVANQEYAKMINDLEKDKKGASKKRHNQYTEAVRRYLSLPLVNSDGTPLMNDQELKAYAESVARLNQSVPDHSLMDMNLATRVLNDYNEIPSKLEKSDFNDTVNDIKNSTISDLTEYNEFVKKVNKAKRILDSLYNNGKVTEDEYNDALNDLYTKENGLRVYERDHNDQIDLLKYDLINDILEAKNYVDKSGFIGQQAEVYKRLEIMLTTTPSMIRSLDVKDLVKLTEVMDRMADGFVAEKELREIVNKAETRGQKKGESIVNQLASIYKSLNSPDLTKLRNLLKLTEPAQIERVLGLASGPIYNNIIQPINSAFTKMRKNTERLMDDYYKARQDNKFKGDVVVKRSEYDKGLGSKISENITVKADKYYSTRVAMLSSIFDYASKAMEQKADTKDFWGENLEKDDVKKAYHNDGSLHIVNDIYSKLNNDPRFQTNGKLDYTKIYEAFVNDPKSVMSDAEYKLYEATQTINNEEIGQALVSANAIRGINGEISAVHYPRKPLGKSSSQDADLVAGTGGKVGGLRAGSSYSRVLETPTDAIDLNLDRVMATQIYEASRDLYLNDAIQQTNEVFRNAKENANPDEKAILQAIQDWNRKRIDFEMEKSAKNVITRAFGGFASYALIGKVRTPAEFATNLLSGIFNQLSNVAKIGPRALVNPINPLQTQESKKIMEKFDSPVQFMSWNMKTYATYGKGKVDKNYLSSFYNNTVNMLMNISGPLTVGEWRSDFDAKFKELTGEKYNESKHLENDEYFYAMQEASSYANQQIERIKGGAFKGQGKQFVAVNPITDIKKLFPGVKIKDEEGMVSSNDTFAQMTNVFNNFIGRDVKNFVSGAFQAGTGRDVSGGIKDMIGSSYRIGSYYLIYNLIDAAMKSAFGDDEEKKKGEKKMEMFSTEEGRWDTAFNTVLNFVTTVATSKYGANGRAIAVGCLNYLYNSTENKEQKKMAADALSSMYFQEPVEMGQYGAAEKFIYMATTMYIPPADVIANQAQKEFDRLAGSDKYKGATITDFFDQAGKFFNDSEVVEYRKFLAGGLTLITQIGVVTGTSFPFLKDIVKLVKKDIQDKQNIIILNKNGENMVEGVLDFDIDGNGQLSVTVDVPGMPADQKKVLNETLSNAASDKFAKLIEKNKSRIENMPENNIEQEAEKFAQIQYYADLAKHQAKVEAKLAKPEEAPKEPSLSSDYFESREAKEKMVEKYQAARATGKFSSASKLSTSKDVQEGVQKLIENNEYKDTYKALDPNKVEDIGGIQAMNAYFNDLYKYNVTPVPGKEPKASDYFKKDYKGKITPVE